MAVRPIDGNKLHAEISKWPESVMYKDWVQSAIANAPTLTPPNEWVSVEKRNPNLRRVGACEDCTWQHLDGDDYPCALCNRNPHLTDRYTKDDNT